MWVDRPDVAVVVADHPERPGRGELLDEVDRPADQLAAQAHHQQQRRGVVVTVHLVLDGDPVHVRGRHAPER